MKEYLFRGIHLDFNQFIQNLLFSIFIFIPMLFEFFIYRTKSAIILFLIYISIHLILLHLFKKWFFWISIPILLFSALITPYILITKNKLSYNVISSIFESDYHESVELMYSPFFIKYILIFIFILSFPLLVRYIKFFEYKGDIKIKPIVITFPILLLVGFSSIAELNERVINYRNGLWNYFPLRQLVFIEKSINEGVILINQYKNQNINFEIFEDKSNDISVIFVIGEASRRSSLNIYGSRYSTTPYITNLAINNPANITSFSKMISVAPFTRVAVPSLLSMTNALNYDKVSITPSIFKILRQTNIETTFVSIRNQNTFHESLANEIIKDNTNIINSDEKHDGDLLPSLYKIINTNPNQKKLITFHLTGSHYIYKKRYPVEYNCFTPDILEGNYLSSLRYTDFVLSEIIKYVEKNQKPYILVYISDHGEYANDNGDEIYGHGFKTLVANEIEIPLIFVYNSKFKKKCKSLINQINKHKKSKVSLDNISHILLGLLGISDSKYYDSSYNVASKDFREHNRYVINRDMEISNIKDIKFNNNFKKNIKFKEICK